MSEQWMAKINALALALCRADVGHAKPINQADRGTRTCPHAAVHHQDAMRLRREGVFVAVLTDAEKQSVGEN